MHNHKDQHNNIKAVVLAAGVGSRINEITKSIPKTMIEINGKCIYEYIIESLVDNHIYDVVFIIGYRSDILEPILRNKCSKLGINLEIVINEQYETTNTMYSLWLARDLLKTSFLYLHGDLIFSSKMLSLFMKYPQENCILVDENRPLDWDDAMKIISNNNLLKYMSKSITVNEMDGIAIGMYKFNKQGRNILFKTISDLIDAGVTQNWISEAINIMSKHINVNLQISKLHAWAYVDNLVDLESAGDIIKNMELE